MDAAHTEIVFEVAQAPDGGFGAECLKEDIFTQGDSWDELRQSVKEATMAYYFDGIAPAAIRLHLVHRHGSHVVPPD